MNDVMKKRLIGVGVLVIIGVLTPLLLSRCMHTGSEDDGSAMRVYNVQPDGESERADGRQDNAAANQDDERLAANDQAGRPSNRSDQSGENNPDNASPSESDFATPPVHGNADDAGEASDAGKASGGSSEPDSGSRSASSNDSTASRSQNQSKDESRGYASSFEDAQSGQDGNSASEESASGESESRGSSAPGELEKSNIQGWVVQVASFGKRGNAEAMAKKLKSEFSASFTPGQVSGRTLYRVNVGPFDSKQEARSAADRLSRVGHEGLVRNLP